MILSGISRAQVGIDFVVRRGQIKLCVSPERIASSPWCKCDLYQGMPSGIP